MNSTVKYILIAAAAFGAYCLWKKHETNEITTSNTEDNTSNASGGCKTPCNIGDTQTSDCRCISPAHGGTGNNTGGGISFGKGKMLAAPIKPTILKKVF